MFFIKLEFLGGRPERVVNFSRDNLLTFLTEDLKFSKSLYKLKYNEYVGREE